MKFQRNFLACCFAAVAISTARAQSLQTFSGQLSPDMVEVNSGVAPYLLGPAAQEDLKRLPVPLAPGERAYLGRMVFYDFSKLERQGGGYVLPNGHLPPPAKTIPLMMVESASRVVVYVNVHGDSNFTASDRVVLTDPGQDPAVEYHPGDKEGWFKVPIAEPGILKWYPYHMIYSPASAREDSVALLQHFYGLAALQHTTAVGARYLYFSDYVAQGTAIVNGKPTLVQYDVNPLDGKIQSTSEGYYGMDCNGDGIVDGRGKDERMYRHSDTDRVVFHVGDLYLSPGPVDQATGHFVVNQLSAAQYTFIDLKPGKPFPDFSFVDVNGQSHHLSDFRGKYVLLDFWEFGCGPCREDMPFLVEAYAKYKARGFEIIGFDRDDTTMLSKVKDLIRQQKLTWIQASSAIPGSGQDVATLMDTRLRISGYPTVVLLDPAGNVQTLDASEIRGAALSKTLERLLPPKVAGG